MQKKYITSGKKSFFKGLKKLIMLYIFEYRVGKTKRQREDDLEKSRTRHIIPKKPPLGGFLGIKLHKRS